MLTSAIDQLERDEQHQANDALPAQHTEKEIRRLQGRDHSNFGVSDNQWGEHR